MMSPDTDKPEPAALNAPSLPQIDGVEGDAPMNGPVRGPEDLAPAAAAFSSCSG